MSAKSKWFYALIFTASLLVVCVCIAFSPRAHANDASEQEAIIHAMKKIFHRPEAPLQVDPVALEGDAAIAGWSQGEMGGRAFLRKRKGEWTIVLCSGDQLKATETLLTAGLSKQQAEKLAARLSDAEKNLPSARLALFAKFDGLLRIENGQDHPPHKH